MNDSEVATLKESVQGEIHIRNTEISAHLNPSKIARLQLLCLDMKPDYQVHTHVLPIFRGQTSLMDSTVRGLAEFFVCLPLFIIIIPNFLCLNFSQLSSVQVLISCRQSDTQNGIYSQYIRDYIVRLGSAVSHNYSHRPQASYLKDIKEKKKRVISKSNKMAHKP